MVSKGDREALYVLFFFTSLFQRDVQFGVHGKDSGWQVCDT